MTSASAVLTALSRILLADGEYAVQIAAPDDEVVVLQPSDPRPGNPKQTEVLGFESFDGLDILIPITTRKKKRTSRPQINKWGDEEYYKIIEKREFRQARFRVTCGQRYFDVSFSNISNDLSFFESTAVASKLARLYEEGEGAAAVRVEMQDHWRTFAEPHDDIDLPDNFDEEAQGIDGLVEMLIKQLGGSSESDE